MSFQTEASHTNVSNAGNPYTLPTKKKYPIQKIKNLIKPNSKNKKIKIPKSINPKTKLGFIKKPVLFQQPYKYPAILQAHFFRHPFGKD